MKSLWKSKTFWLNIVTFVVMFLSLPEVLGLHSPVQVALAAAVVAAGNILLRLITSTAIGVKGE